MAEIDDTLPKETVSDEAFVETEVNVPEDIVPTQEGQANITMDEEGGAEVDLNPSAVNYRRTIFS